jgi:FkbM family methyltransferase
VSRLRTAAKRLDRPGGRTILSVLASMRLTMKLGRPTLVRWRDDVWVYRWRGATLPHPSIGAAVHPEEARDVVLHAYEPRPGDVVLDVGAGVGDTTLLFSKLVGSTGRVVAIEAHPATFGWLERVCLLNGLENVAALQLAVSDREGELLISDDDTLENTVLDERGDVPSVAVRARRLDDVVPELGIEQIDLLKMNIEGAERLALRGMEETLARIRHACISCHDFMADRGGPDEMRTQAFVMDFLAARGFVVTTRDHRVGWIRSYVYGTRP